jgi:Carbohydrate-binding family 9
MNKTIETKHPIAIKNWPLDSIYPIDVFCVFSIVKNGFNLLFEVSDNIILGETTKINGPVYGDSCVEWFCNFGQEIYYNFEFNAIGTPLVQKGKNRKDRSFLSLESIKTIKIIPSLGKSPIPLIKKNITWKLQIDIPFELFGNDLNINKLKGNFYKCGDNLPNKHYLSRFPIKSIKPDFHRPEFFQKL